MAENEGNEKKDTPHPTKEESPPPMNPMPVIPQPKKGIAFEVTLKRPKQKLPSQGTEE